MIHRPHRKCTTFRGDFFFIFCFIGDERHRFNHCSNMIILYKQKSSYTVPMITIPLSLKSRSEWKWKHHYHLISNHNHERMYQVYFFLAMWIVIISTVIIVIVAIIVLWVRITKFNQNFCLLERNPVYYCHYSCFSCSLLIHFYYLLINTVNKAV